MQCSLIVLHLRGKCTTTKQTRLIHGVGQNRKYTVYLVKSLPKVSCIPYIYMVLAYPIDTTHVQCKRAPTPARQCGMQRAPALCVWLFVARILGLMDCPASYLQVATVSCCAYLQLHTHGRARSECTVLDSPGDL